MKCTNCGVESSTVFCAGCEPIRTQLEELRRKQREHVPVRKLRLKGSRQCGNFKELNRRFGVQ